MLNWLFAALLGLSACGNKHIVPHDLSKNKPENNELKKAKQKSKNEEKKLEETKRTVHETEDKVSGDIAKARDELIASLAELRKSKIPLIQQEIEFLEEYREKARAAFMSLSNRQSKSGVLQSYFEDQIKPAIEVLNKLDDTELTSILEDLQKIISAVVS